MKKPFIAIVVIVIIAFMLYLTKPATNIHVEEATNQTEAIQAGSTSVSPKKLTTAETIETLKCDKDALLEAIEKLKTQRQESLQALTEQGLEAERLSQLIRVHLRDHQLANTIKTQTLPSTEKDTPEQKAISEFMQQNQLEENIFMASLAGQALEPINQFLNGELAPLDPISELHKLYMLNMVSMGGGKQIAPVIDALFPKESTLPPEVVPAIVQSTQDPKLLKQLLSRVSDLNTPVSGLRFTHGSNNARPAISIALLNSNFSAVDIMLDLGVKPNNAGNNNALNFFYRPDEASYPILQKMLDKGFSFSNSAKAEQVSKMIQVDNPELANRISNLSKNLKAQEATEYANLPEEFRQILDDYNAQHEPLNKQYLSCIAQEIKQKPKIPPYQPIDKAKIEKNIEQLVEQNVENLQIIATLGALNKESVEYGYKYLKKLRLNRWDNHRGLTNMPEEVRTLIGLMHQKKWDQLIVFMQSHQFDDHWQITPGTMVGAMLDQKAPEAAIDAMVKISDKNDIKLLNQAMHQPKLLKRIANYGFNLNATDDSNKNLFYQAVNQGSVKQIDLLMNYGINFTSDPFGYDALDSLLRKPNANKEVLTKLAEINFPVTEQHLDYSLYLKTYYPKRYKKTVEAWPELQVDGEWQPKS